ncbi:hypothetical protein AE618_12895 [Bosea vaviloviae]|uniref:Uncharacterized protein n=1 Tax=Bosea vaviloviae TaxID=1526658 RepID=A0A0N0MB96_9HYPH|nr:hypothetical protein AE618_12895 [Bosea vaviloviae]
MSFVASVIRVVGPFVAAQRYAALQHAIAMRSASDQLGVRRPGMIFLHVRRPEAIDGAAALCLRVRLLIEICP